MAFKKTPRKTSKLRNLNKIGMLIKSYLGLEEVLLEVEKIANPMNSAW